MTTSLRETYAQTSSRLVRAARAFMVQPDANQHRRRVQVRIPHSALPLPEIARAVSILIGAEDRGRSEKTAFEILSSFEGTPFVFASRKFGPDLNVWLPEGAPDSAADDLADRMLAALKRLTKIAEVDVFDPAIRASVDAGDLVLKNNAGALRSQYHYFRDGAVIGFEGKGRLQKPLPDREHVGDLDDPGEDIHRLLQQNWHTARMKDLALKEGSFNASSMVNAYFSYLEHYLSLATAFTDLEPPSLAITKFLGDSWAAKFKTVFDVSRLAEAKALYDRLLHVAETYRNPLAHGGWDKRGPTASVTLEGIGRVPLMISGFENTVGFRLDVFNPDGFDDVCEIFDDVDALLATIGNGNAHEWISTGFDVSFETRHRSKYRSSAVEFHEYLDWNEQMWERDVNMDW